MGFRHKAILLYIASLLRDKYCIVKWCYVCDRTSLFFCHIVSYIYGLLMCHHAGLVLRCDLAQLLLLDHLLLSFFARCVLFDFVEAFQTEGHFLLLLLDGRHGE